MLNLNIDLPQTYHVTIYRGYKKVKWCGNDIKVVR